MRMISPNLNVNFSANMFCKDGICFSIHGKKKFQFIARSANLYIFTINLPSLCQIMADQTHCLTSKRHLRKEGIWCVICEAYIHVSCSGLQSSNFYYDGFSFKQCTPQNFAKEPNSTNRPTSTAPITTQKETSPATPETNILSNATHSNP